MDGQLEDGGKTWQGLLEEEFDCLGKGGEGKGERVLRLGGK
jgi:hypothetical protein